MRLGREGKDDGGGDEEGKDDGGPKGQRGSSRGNWQKEDDDE